MEDEIIDIDYKAEYEKVLFERNALIEELEKYKKALLNLCSRI